MKAAAEGNDAVLLLVQTLQQVGFDSKSGFDFPINNPDRAGLCRCHRRRAAVPAAPASLQKQQL